MKKILNEWKRFLNEELVGQTEDPTVAIYKVESGETESTIMKKFGMSQQEYERLNPEPFKGEGSTVKVKIESGATPPTPPTPPTNPLSYKGRGFLDGDPMKLIQRAADVIYENFEDEIKGDFTDLNTAFNMQKRTENYFKDNNIVVMAPASQYIKKMKAAKSEEGVKQISDLLKKYTNLKVVRVLLKNRIVSGSELSGQQEDQKIYILPAIKTQKGQILIFKPSESGWKTTNLRGVFNLIYVTSEPE